MNRLFALLFLAQTLAVPALAQTPADPFDAHLKAAQTAMQAGLPLVAAREYRAALALHPRDAAACYALAQLLEEAGRRDEALAQYRETIRLDPDNAPAHNALAGLLEQNGETAAALAQRRQALVLEPNNPLLHFNLGAALEDAGQRAAARAEYQAALRLKPDFPEAQEAMREVFPVGSPLPARKLATLSSEGKVRKEGSIKDALALEAAGRLTEAIAALRTTVKADPSDAAARLHLGIALYADGQTAPARREWRRVESLPDAGAARQARRLLARYR